MGAQTLAKRYERVPLLFEDFFKPWNGWFGDEGSLLNRVLSVPAANITENKDYYEVALAVPGMEQRVSKFYRRLVCWSYTTCSRTHCKLPGIDRYLYVAKGMDI